MVGPTFLGLSYRFGRTEGLHWCPVTPGITKLIDHGLGVSYRKPVFPAGPLMVCFIVGGHQREGVIVMARSRNIKPGFFVSDEVVSCTFAARLLFIGLWCLADRDGKLEEKQRAIKRQIFPDDNVDMESLLQELADQELIIRYRVDGADYILIPKFSKHQHPHQNETSNDIPDP